MHWEIPQLPHAAGRSPYSPRSPSSAGRPPRLPVLQSGSRPCALAPVSWDSTKFDIGRLGNPLLAPDIVGIDSRASYFAAHAPNYILPDIAASARLRLL